MDKERLIKDYETAVNAIAVTFLNKQFADEDEPPITDVSGDFFWVGGDVGGVLDCAGEHSYDFGDIVTDIKEDAPVGELDRHISYCVRCYDLGLTEKKINYRSWLHGAPLPYSIEGIERFEQIKAEFENEIKKANERRC